MSGTVLPARILEKISFSDGCWEWLAARNKGGYGMVCWEKKMRIAHRVVYEILVGEITPSLHAHHKCRNRGCVNPEHVLLLSAHDHALLHPDSNQSWRDKQHARTHCSAGHELTPDNTKHKNGRRICRICDRNQNTLHQRVSRARRRKSFLAP